ncbi:MAG: hypothetical protein SF162_18620 [bacterium]|nr:hypothetical protein [bacterium]
MSVMFLGLNRVVIDPEQVRAQSPAAVGGWMAGQFGGEPVQWERAYRTLIADWDSYFADLDFAGDDGVAALWESEIRLMRGLFRLAGLPIPPLSEMSKWAYDMPRFMYHTVRAAYPDVPSALALLSQRGYKIALFADVSSHRISGLLGGIWPGEPVALAGLLGLDVTGRFRHDAAYWQIAALKAGAAPEMCIVIDALAESIDGAQAAGMRAFLLNRANGERLIDLVRRL